MATFAMGCTACLLSRVVDRGGESDEGVMVDGAEAIAVGHSPVEMGTSN